MGIDEMAARTAGTAAGSVGFGALGAGTGCAIGMVVLGPPGAAIGWAIGTLAGVFSGGAAGNKLASKAFKWAKK